MDSYLYKFCIHYYCREKYYTKMYKLSKQALSATNEIIYIFYSGIAFIMKNQLQDGIRELMKLESEKEFRLAITIALIFGHKNAININREALLNLESKLKDERKQTDCLSLYHTAIFLSLAGKYEKCSDYLIKAQKKDPKNEDIQVLKLWNEMIWNFNNLNNNLRDSFEAIALKSTRNVECLFGWARFEYYTKKFDSSNIILDKIIVKHSDCVIPIIEKMRNEFAMKKWDSVSDIIERVLNMEPTNVEAWKVKIFLVLCKSGDYIIASDQLNRFYNVLENEEPKNGYQFCYVAKLFSSLSSRSNSVLSGVYKFAQYASEMFPTNVDYLTEVGYQCLLQGKPKDAINFFKAASKIDSNSINALCGLSICQIKDNGVTEQVLEQIELLNEMQSNNKLPRLLLLTAKVSKDKSKAISILNDVFKIKINEASLYPLSLEYVGILDPDFLMDTFYEYKKYLPVKPYIYLSKYFIYNEDQGNEDIMSCVNVLKNIVDACPGYILAVYELAKIKFVYGFSTEALKIVQHILDLDGTHPGSHILMSQIYLQRQLYSKSLKCLDVCLSYNFKIRDNPMYHMIIGLVHVSCSRYHDALNSFTNCMQLLETTNSVKESLSYERTMNIIDKATLYLEMMNVLELLNRQADASKLMQNAIQQFTYTTEENRFVIAKAESCLKNGDIDQSIELLSEIKPDQPYYFEAHTKLAHIYLKEKNNREMFSNCYRDIVSIGPNTDTHIMMGDAYMAIADPVYAIDCYASAIESSNNSCQLVMKMGEALMKTHQYDKLMKHYEDAFNRIDNEDLKYNYYEILLKIKQYEKVYKMITDELSTIPSGDKDTSLLQKHVKLLLLQVKACEHLPNVSSRGTLLTQARKIQTSIVRKIEIDARGDLQEEKRLLSEILCWLATLPGSKDPISLYTEALANVPRDPDILIALARLYAETNNPVKCEQTCAILLNTDPSNESASIMMAELAYRKGDFDTAQEHFESVVVAKPQCWEALIQLVEVAYRRGSLNDIDKTLDLVRTSIGNDVPCGYSYICGLLSLYTNKPNAALKYFNTARQDEQFKSRAAKMMCLLCITYVDDDTKISKDLAKYYDDLGDTKTLAMKTAERLYHELNLNDRRAVHALIKLTSNQKTIAEQVVVELTSQSGGDNVDDPLALLALATAYNQLKQTSRMKSVLKKTFSDISWTPEKADGLERCWLELAEISLNSGRTEVLREIINKLLKYNKSCGRAYRYAGHLAEKDQNHKAALKNYEQAWLYSGKTDFTIGYKLAQLALKQRKYPQAIVICKHILTQQPDFPKIRKEIFEKATSNLRA